MKTRIAYKDTFAVIGKMAQGSADAPQKWIFPLWESAFPRFSEIEGIVKHNDDGSAAGIWGAMNDINEQNKRWGETGKYMAGCEADIETQAPENWSKWIIPAQTYLVADCTMDTYSEVFDHITNDKNIQITGTVHERYPQPENPDILELWFPIAAGMMFCQSCGMPLSKSEDFGTETDGGRSMDYCHYCYGNGTFFKEETMNEMIETCIPFCLEHYGSADEARKAMREIFPQLKRWKK